MYRIYFVQPPFAMTVTLLCIAFLIMSMEGSNVIPCIKNYILFKSLANLRRNLITYSFPATLLDYVISQTSLVVFFFFLFLPSSSCSISSFVFFSMARGVKKTEGWCIPISSITSLYFLTHYFYHTILLTLSPWQFAKPLPAGFAYIASVNSLRATLRILIFDKACFLVKATFHLRRQGISKIPDYTGIFHVIYKTKSQSLN